MQRLCHAGFRFKAAGNFTCTREFHAFCVKFVTQTKTHDDGEEGKQRSYFFSLSSDCEMMLGRGT